MTIAEYVQKGQSNTHEATEQTQSSRHSDISGSRYAEGNVQYLFGS